MTVTVTPDGPPQPPGHQKEVQATVAIGTYATNGVAVAAADFGLSELLDVIPQGQTTNGYSTRFDKASKKLLVYRTDQVDDPSEEVPNSTDLSAESVRVRAIGW